MFTQARVLWMVLAIAAGATALTFGSLKSKALAEAQQPDATLGKEITKLGLKDSAGKTWALGDLKGKKGVVVLFLGTQCPVNNAYMPRLVELNKTYGDKGVLFVAINSNKQDTPEMIKAHIKEFKLPFAVLRDDAHSAADHFGATRTPEVFVLDGDLKVRYHGRIDDQFGAGFQRSNPNRQDLAIALDEMLAGKKITVA